MCFVNSMQSFENKNGIESIPGFKYVSNLEGIEQLVMCTHTRLLNERIIPAIKDLGEYDDRNRIIVSVCIRPLIYAISQHFDPNLLCDLDTDSLVLLYKLQLSKDEFTSEIKKLCKRTDISETNKYLLLGRFPENSFCSVNGDAFKLHAYMYEKGILPEWWQDDLDLYLKMLIFTRAWAFPFYAENLQHVAYSDAKEIVDKGHYLNIFTYLWSRDMKAIMKKRGAVRACSTIDLFQFSSKVAQWFSINVDNVNYTIPVYNYYQFKDNVLALISKSYADTVIKQDTACGITLCFISSSVTTVSTPYWYCASIKPKFDGDDFPVKSYLHDVFRLLEYKQTHSDFDLITKMYPVISRVFFDCGRDNTKSLPDELRKVLFN